VISLLTAPKDRCLAGASNGRFLNLDSSPAGLGKEPLFAIATLAALWPVWRWYLLRLNDGSDEPLGALALITGAVLVWPVRSRLTPNNVSLVVAASLLVFYALAYPVLLPLPRALVGITAAALAIGLHRAPAGAWGLLILSLPLMASLQFYCNHPLQKITAQGAAFLINLWPNIEVSVRGTLLHWQGNPVAVDPPCSGIKMLWVGGFVHFALATYHRHSWKILAWLSPVALLTIVAANSVRAALLFPKEASVITLPDWTHAGIGLLVFAGSLALMTKFYAKLAPTNNGNAGARSTSQGKPSTFAKSALLTSTTIAALTPLFSTSRADQSDTTAFPGWPSEFEGRTMFERELGPHERAFAKNFPGRLGVFDDSDSRRVILRWVTQPTRKLHSSADCLRAAGCIISFEKSIIKQNPWRHFTAESDDQILAAREQIFSTRNPQQSWSDISEWYWAAGKDSESGPWLAVTVIEVHGGSVVSPEK
jgi:exosortase/archaeosortase family protein